MPIVLPLFSSRLMTITQFPPIDNKPIVRVWLTVKALNTANTCILIGFPESISEVSVALLSMAEPTYAFVIWGGSQQKSVIKRSTITNGIAAATQQVTAKWKSKNYAATVIQTGNYVLLYTVQQNNHHTCLWFCM